MTVVSDMVRRQLQAMPTIREEEAHLLLSEILPNDHGVDPGDLKIDTVFQGLPTAPLRVYVSPYRRGEVKSDPPYPYEDHPVQVVRYNGVRRCWEWGSKSDLQAAFEAAERAGLIPARSA